MKLLLFVLVFVFNFFVEKSAHAYPAAVRLGYPNCTSCHYNPAGGMTLTPYGRALSRELISTYGVEGEENFLWGTTESIRPKWLELGADLRTSYVKNVNKPEKSVSRMTVSDLEILVGNEKTRATVDVGFRELSDGATAKGTPKFNHNFFSRRHYLNYSLNDYWSVRGGKFSPNFGLWNGDPSNSVRAGIGLGDASETYNLEANYIGEDTAFSLTGVLGSDPGSTNKNEKGLFFSATKTINTVYRLGVGGFSRENDFFKRTGFGEATLFGFSQRSYFYSEAYVQDVEDKQNRSKALGLYSFNRFGYEFLFKQAFFILLSHDLTIRNLEDFSGRKEYYAVGFQWMPRPHLEFQTHWRKTRDLSVGTSFGDEFVFNFHLYH